MKRNEIAVFVGGRIKAERLSRMISQEALALESDIHPSYFGCIERGEKCPTIETLYKISNALGIDLNDLLRTPDPEEPDRLNAEKRILYAIRKIPDEKIDDAASIIERLAGLIE